VIVEELTRSVTRRPRASCGAIERILASEIQTDNR
jgi:hypothetical protein